MADDNKPAVSAEAEAAPGKAKEAKPAKKKRGLGKRFLKFFRDSKGEFKKIIWPTWATIVRNTGVTLAMCAILGVAISLFDLGLSSLLKLMLSL